MIVSKIEQLRDPFVLIHNGVYYCYGTGWVCYKNTSGSLDGDWECLGQVAVDTDDVEGCRWAPEVHRYTIDGVTRFYMFTTYLSRVTHHRGCVLLVSDTPEGPFVPMTAHPITPMDWDCIDGTFYVDQEGQPWMVFVHEWTSTDDGCGRMAAAKLSADLTHFITEPIELFRADDPTWACGKVTDGCFLYDTHDGELLMIWSNWDNAGYCVGVARSNNGTISGKWTQDETLLYSKNMMHNCVGAEYDGGHGMIFTDVDGQLYLSIHSPNNASAGRRETPVFLPIREEKRTTSCGTTECGTTLSIVW